MRSQMLYWAAQEAQHTQCHHAGQHQVLAIRHCTSWQEQWILLAQQVLLLGYRQVDTLMGRVDKLPSPEDWTIMEEALAAILDEAAARAQQQDKLKELDAAHEQSKSGVRSLLQMELFRLLAITAEVLVHD